MAPSPREGQLTVYPNELSHWARVALAAECAAIVFPLFKSAWPEVSEKRGAAVFLAIELATRAAAEEQPCPGLEKAAFDSHQASGRAQIPHLCPVSINDGEQSPADSEKSAIASFVAKAAELAARAAMGESQSDDGRQSFFVALDAARQAGREDLVERIWKAAWERVRRRRMWWKIW